MTDTWQAVRDHLHAHAPKALRVSRHEIHLPRCRNAPTDSDLTTAEAVTALADSTHLTSCAACKRRNEWIQAMCQLHRRVPDLALRDTPTRTDLLATRTNLTREWLEADPTREDLCCGRRRFTPDQPWDSRLRALLAEHTHTRLHQLLTTRAPATRWVALGRHAHLLSRGVRQYHPLEELGHAHAWASTSRAAQSVVVMHLPRHLANDALAEGAVRLDPAHITPTTWAVARVLLQQRMPIGVATLEQRAQGELELLPQVPDLFAVAHAAAH